VSRIRTSREGFSELVWLEWLSGGGKGKGKKGREVLYRRWIGSSGLRHLLCPFWFFFGFVSFVVWMRWDGMGKGCDY